jgi:hypothetical protein
MLLNHNDFQDVMIIMSFLNTGISRSWLLSQDTTFFLQCLVVGNHGKLECFMNSPSQVEFDSWQ